jgi:TPR repeat protein
MKRSNPILVLSVSCLLSLVSVCGYAEDMDCRTAPFGEFRAAFNQLADGLDYSDEGEIVRASGKRLNYNDATRIAFLHYIARENPSVTITVSRSCSTCGGKGRGVRLEGRDGANLGYQVHWVCSACEGRGLFVETATRRLVYSGELPLKWESPKVIAFRGRINSARDGNPSAQLEVAKGYLEGKVIPKSVNDALKWFTEAAKQGERDALAPLSQLYLDPANEFNDFAYGLALSAVADSTLARVDGPDFVAFDAITNNATDPEAGLNRYLQVVEAGLLAPRISQGLNDKAQIEKVLSPELVRKSFPLKAPITAAALADKRALFVRGVARYFGYGFAAPDRSEALRLIEEAACKQDAEAFVMIALHYDTAKEYPASEPTAWAFYSLARSLGSVNPFCLSRLSKFAETDVAVDWAGAPEALLVHLQQGRFTPAVIRDLADLSLYRIVRPAAAAPGAPNPFDTAATQETPLSKAQVISKARTMLHLKLKVIEIAPDDECVFRKCWDDGTNRFYSVSGIVTFTNAESRREIAPFTVCFKAADASSTPVLLYCSAGSSLFGEFPAECGRRP